MKTTLRKTISEYGAVELDLKPEAALDLQRHFPTQLEVAPTAASGRYRIKAGSHVGTVVGPGFELRIRPKCGTRNLFYLLSYAYRLAAIRRELVGQEEVDDIREFLLKILSGQLQDLLRLGLRWDYIEHRRDLPVLRGRLLVEKHLRRGPGRQLELPCEYEEFTPDVIHNQILRFTLRQTPPPSDPVLLGQLQRLERVLSVVSLEAFRPDQIDAVVYTRLNAHYEPIHQLCRLLLEGSGIEQETGPRAVSSFLIDMDMVFERFVAGWLVETLPAKVSVHTQRSGTLDRTGHLHIKPDLLFSSDGAPFLVADTKYKLTRSGKPRHDDAYQILAYCRGLNLPLGLLIYAENIPTPLRFPIRHGDDVIVSSGVAISGSVEEIEEQLKRLADQVLRQRHQMVESNARIA